MNKKIEKSFDAEELISKDIDIVDELLKDKTTGNNIIWACDDYEQLGTGYSFKDEIKSDKIIGSNSDLIIPRNKKAKDIQKCRSKIKAEVFTPSYICNIQNNAVDEEWFQRENVFNKAVGSKWITNYEKIEFPLDKTYQDYIYLNRLEITCGEAPYLVSRYDTVTGDDIKIIDRIGLLDRKLRVINENVEDEKEWYSSVLTAYKSIYGYEWQGDNVFLARKNLLLTFIEYYCDRFNKKPLKKQIKEICNIITWNIIQMDGLKFVIPGTCHDEIVYKNSSVFDLEDQGEIEIRHCDGCSEDILKGINMKNKVSLHNGISSKTMDWQEGKTILFYKLLGQK